METRAAVAHAAGKPLSIETVSLGPSCSEMVVKLRMSENSTEATWD